MLEHSPFDGSETYNLSVELEGTIILFGAEFDTHCTDIYIYIHALLLEYCEVKGCIKLCFG